MNYHDDFETWFKIFSQASPSPKGRKYEAYQVWENLTNKHELPPLDVLIEGVRKHASNDRYFKGKGQFVPSWQHACRWLKNRTWECEDEAEKEREKRIQARQRELEKYREQQISLQNKEIPPDFDWNELSEQNPDNPFYRRMALNKNKSG